VAEVSEDASFLNVMRFRDQSEGDRHVISLSGLQPDKSYVYRLLCASSSAQGEFTTASAAE
jgi:phosphodiesterase/alkaline phosphatase D-like protein